MQKSRGSLFLAGCVALAASATLAPSAGAAISASVAWDTRATGSDTNGGGFHVGASGVDYSQQNSPQWSVTDGVTAGTTTITSATANFDATIVGNVVYVSGGTGSITASWYEVTAFNSATSITVDRSTGLTAGTGVTLHVGGALASPGGTAGMLALTGVGASGQSVYVKSGTYAIGNGTANTSGNRVNTTVAGILWSGYQATHGDLGTRPVLQATAGSITLFTYGNSSGIVENLEFQGNGQTSVVGLTVSQNTCVVNSCKFNALTGTQACNMTGTADLVLGCEATGCTGANAFFSSGAGNVFAGCYAHGGSAVGFGDTGNSGKYIDCISAANSNHGFNLAAGPAFVVRCLAYANTGGTTVGISATANNGAYLYGCLSVGNGQYNYSVGTLAVLTDCAGYNTGTANTNGTPRINTGFVTLTGEPTVAGGSGNFALNNTAGAGAACRAAGWPSSWPGASSTTGHPDIGPVQHADPGQTGGKKAGPGGGKVGLDLDSLLRIPANRRRAA